jgi:hypothetical protein
LMMMMMMDAWLCVDVLILTVTWSYTTDIDCFKYSPLLLVRPRVIKHLVTEYACSYYARLTVKDSSYDFFYEWDCNGACEFRVKAHPYCQYLGATGMLWNAQIFTRDVNLWPAHTAKTESTNGFSIDAQIPN